MVGVASALVLAVAGGARADARANAPRDPLLDSVRALVEDGFPGAVAYARTGSDVRYASAGYADIETREPATPAHRFRIASNTKAFTAAVLLQLVGERRVDLDTRVERYLPGVLGGRAITVRQLLDHTSGLYDPTTEPAFWAPYLNGDRGFVYRPRDIVAAAVAHPPVTPPGYSNTNYLVAGMVIEAVTGRSAISEVYQRILVPLHLTHTSFPRTDPHVPGRHLHGYDLHHTDVTVFSPSYDWTAGAMVSTVDDLARFHRALFDGTLLRPNLLAELKKGLGVERHDLPCPDGTTRVVWGNTGGGPGYNSYSLVDEDTSRQLVLALNTYDIAAELRGDSPLPDANPLPVLTRVFC
jgi:D-alanyl-D-alanine carboxypeptidase